MTTKTNTILAASLLISGGFAFACYSGTAWGSTENVAPEDSQIIDVTPEMKQEAQEAGIELPDKIDIAQEQFDLASVPKSNKFDEGAFESSSEEAALAALEQQEATQPVVETNETTPEPAGDDIENVTASSTIDEKDTDKIDELLSNAPVTSDTKPNMSSLSLKDLYGENWADCIQSFQNTTSSPLPTFSPVEPTLVNYAKMMAVSTWRIKAVSGTTSYNNGKNVQPKIRVYYKGSKTLVPTNLYKVSYSKATKVGQAGKVTVTATWDKTKKRTLNFKVAKASIKKAQASKPAARTYTGKAIKPGITVKYNGKKLVKGKDYTLSYSNNTKVGTAKIKITGKGNFTGTATRSFKIVKKGTAIERVATFNGK